MSHVCHINAVDIIVIVHDYVYTCMVFECVVLCKSLVFNFHCLLPFFSLHIL